MRPCRQGGWHAPPTYDLDPEEKDVTTVARVVTAFPKYRRPTSTHDWSKLFDGHVWLLERGIDFENIGVMCEQIDHQAKLRGRRVHWSACGRKIHLQDVGPESAECMKTANTFIESIAQTATEWVADDEIEAAIQRGANDAVKAAAKKAVRDAIKTGFAWIGVR